MNNPQITGILRIVVPVALTVFGGMIGKSFTPESAATVTDVAINAITGVVTAASVIWSWWANSSTVRVASVAAMPDVVKVFTAATPTGRALAEAVPGDNVLVASNPAPQTGIGRPLGTERRA